jgi:transposase InsO family protein
MPWQEQSVMSLKQEFVVLASAEGANLRELCRRFGVSPPTGYKWLRRFAAEGTAGLTERSRRPTASPAQTPATVEAEVIALRDVHPTWGGRKLRRRLEDLGHAPVPAASTITAILRRHGRLDPAEAAKHTAWRRFAHPAPNDLWQLDFKGHFALGSGRCHPLTVLDDHSRYLLGLVACADERTTTVQAALTALFRRYGLPWRMLTDNGPPWGAPWPPGALTTLGVWLLRLGVAVSHGRPFHPQTQGKAERLHRTLGSEVLRAHAYRDLAACQGAFDAWRATYNHDRPHEALALATPASRYASSPRPFPDRLPPIEYESGTIVRTVHHGGQISYRGHAYFVSQALRGERVALHPTTTDGLLAIAFGRHPIGLLDLRAAAPVQPLPAEEATV